MTGQFYYPEIIAPGVALLDYDNDDDLDVFLVQGGRIDRRARADAVTSRKVDVCTETISCFNLMGAASCDSPT